MKTSNVKEDVSAPTNTNIIHLTATATNTSPEIPVTESIPVAFVTLNSNTLLPTVPANIKSPGLLATEVIIPASANLVPKAVIMPPRKPTKAAQL